jgi:hypothetical protein
MGKPKEDPKDKAARERERRISEIERNTSTQQSASSLTTDLRAIYGMRGIPFMQGTAMAPAAAARPSYQAPRGSDR